MSYVAPLFYQYNFGILIQGHTNDTSGITISAGECFGWIIWDKMS